MKKFFSWYDSFISNIFFLYLFSHLQYKFYNFTIVFFNYYSFSFFSSFSFFLLFLLILPFLSFLSFLFFLFFFSFFSLYVYFVLFLFYCLLFTVFEKKNKIKNSYRKENNLSAGAGHTHGPELQHGQKCCNHVYNCRTSRAHQLKYPSV